MSKCVPVPGDVIETTSGELYVYLGYYAGRPFSVYARPDGGYLYAFVGTDITDQHGLARDLLGEAYSRIRHEIDGSGCYVKSPKAYVHRHGHVMLDPGKIKYAFGLTRVADRRPSARDERKD